MILDWGCSPGTNTAESYMMHIQTWYLYAELINLVHSCKSTFGVQGPGVTREAAERRCSQVWPTAECAELRREVLNHNPRVETWGWYLFVPGFGRFGRFGCRFECQLSHLHCCILPGTYLTPYTAADNTFGVINTAFIFLSVLVCASTLFR